MDKRFPGSGAQGGLLGRARERAALDAVLRDIRKGESRSLVVRGEPGIGKTALLDWMVESAADLTVLRATGVESEMELPYASLHQLCAPRLDLLDRLPAPQCTALATAFGLGSGDPPDRFLVGLGTLSLLAEVAEERPLLCVVDDAQWLDRASELTLTFVARRLLAEPAGIVFAARELGEQLRRIPAIEVRGLGADDADVLLRSVVRPRLDEGVRARIAAEARGNPLALLELPRGLDAPQWSGEFGLLEVEGLPGRIEESFMRRIGSLPEEARLLLVIAAAEPVGDPLLLWGAAEKLAISEAAIEDADSTELAAIGQRVLFRHPLARSAVYRSATVDERRLAHLALSEVTDPAVDPDRRAWHLACAAAGPDEQIAAELERAAGRAQTRGGLAAAAAFLQRAVALTEEPSRRAQRALAAAEAGLSAGAFDSARALLAAAEAGPLDPLQRARADLLQAQAAYAQRHGSDAPPLLLRAAKALEGLDARLARDTYLDAWSAALFAGRLAGSVDVYDVSRAARNGPPPADPARPSDLLLDGLAMLLTDGRSAAVPVIQQAAKRFAGDDASAAEVLRWGWLATVAAVVVWDYPSCVAVAGRAVELARDAGALGVLPVALNIMAQAVAMSGDFDRAARLVAEADAVTDVTGTQVLQYGALYLSAYQGREADVARLVDATVRDATAGGQGNAIGFTSLAQAVVANGRGRYADAVAPAMDASTDIAELVVPMWGLIEVVEAAVRSGDDDLARDAVERLAARNEVGANDWGLGVEARSRALLSDDDAAESLYREAVERLGRTRLRPEVARAQLLYGEWLRRNDRRVDAREQLHAAYEQFTSIGMAAFAERARRELQATGEKVRKRSIETHDELTDQERQIAILARDGLSNPEIGARLFLSPKTIEYHLGKVFAKLAIGSRRELAKALALPESAFLSA